MGCIRRINLDAIQSRPISIIDINKFWSGVDFRMLEQVGVQGACENFGPLGYYSHFNDEMVIQICHHHVKVESTWSSTYNMISYDDLGLI